MTAIKNEKLRTVLRFVIPFLLIPAAAILGETVFDEKKHLLVSFAVAVLSLLLFLTGFEQKQTGTRRMVIVAVMIALSVAGRFIPVFKPITAITVITAIWLGSESGFLVGSFSALLSNFYFGQGPWTAFQMPAWGMIGWIAGLLAESLKKHRIALILYGVLSGIAYSFIMDIWSVLGHHDTFNWNLYFAALTTAVPYTVLYSVSNFIFLWFMAKPFGEKLNRIRIKYGV
ncbi:MAG: ECF transporter S component [Clostridia bacterium]|nr:ECF transporter S component [Clostridia bacterium]